MIEIIKENNVLIVKSKIDKLYSSNVTEFREEIKNIDIDSNVILDCASMNFVDSSGLSAIISLYKRCQAKDVSLEVTNACTAIVELFDITKLNQVIKVSEAK